MPETVPHESPAHPLPPDTYAAVLANNPDLHPDLASHLQRLASEAGEPGFASSEVATIPEQVSPLAAIENETVIAAEENPSRHDWHKIAAESNPTGLHATVHDQLADRFGAGDADPDKKLEIAIEAELGAGAEFSTVTVPEGVKQTDPVAKSGVNVGELPHDEAVSLHETPAGSVELSQALSVEEKQGRAADWIASHTVTKAQEVSTSGWGGGFGYAGSAEPKAELQFGEDEMVPAEYASEIAGKLLASEDYDARLKFRANIDKFPALDSDVATLVLTGDFPSDIVKYSDKFPGISLDAKLADELIDRGQAWAVVEGAEKFEGVTLDASFANKLVGTGQADAVIESAEKFSGVELNAEFVDNALKNPNNTWAIAANVGKFQGVEGDDSLAERILATGRAEALALNLDKFSGLSNETASKVAGVGLNLLLDNTEKFPDLKTEELVDIVTSSPSGLYGIGTASTEVQSAVAVAIMSKGENLDLMHFSKLDHTVAEAYIEKGLGGELLKSADKFIGFSPDFDFAQKLIAEDPTHPGLVLKNLDRFPADTHDAIAQLIAENGGANLLKSYVGDERYGFSDELTDKVQRTYEASFTDDAVKTYLENFPSTDHTLFAVAYMERASGGENRKHAAERLAKGIGELSGLDKDVARTLLDYGQDRAVGDNLSRFSGLDLEFARGAITSVGGPIAHNLELFATEDRQPIVDELFRSGNAIYLAPDILAKYPLSAQAVVGSEDVYLSSESQLRLYVERVEDLPPSERPRATTAARQILGEYLSTDSVRLVKDILDDAPSEARQQLGITSSGEKGLAQLQETVQEFVQDIHAVELSDETIERAINVPFFGGVLKSATRYDESQWGVHSQDRFMRTLQYNLDAKHDGRLVEMPAEYTPSAVQEISLLKQAEKVEWTSDVLERYATLRSELTEVGKSRADKQPLSSLVGELKTEIDRLVQGFDAKLADEALPEKDRIGIQRRRDQLSVLVTPDSDNPDRYPLRSLKEFQQHFRTLASSKELHAPMRKIAFAWALRKNPEWQDRLLSLGESPNTTDVSNVNEFVEHITNQEVFAQYFNDKKSASVFKGMVNTKALQAGLLRQQGVGLAKDTVSMQFVPTRGVMMEFSGHIADACWASKYDSIAESMPNATAVIIKQRPGTATEKLAGAGLLIETTDAVSGEPTLVVRGLNPLQNTINTVSAEQFYDSFMNYAGGIAKKRGMKLAVVLDGKSGGASTNRPVLAEIMRQKIPSAQRVKVPTHDTTFNGYDISNVTYQA